jgi:hypothetical protein
MHPTLLRYRRSGHHAPGATVIVLEFEREDGGLFQMALPIADTERLHGDLMREIAVARQKP